MFKLAAMIVVDASVLVDVLTNADDSAAVATLASADGLAAPDLIDVEVANVLRRLWLNSLLDETRFQQALHRLRSLPMQRYPALPLLDRVFKLRDNLTAYDALYVALAESIDCPLATKDQRLARAAGPTCEIRIV